MAQKSITFSKDIYHKPLESGTNADLNIELYIPPGDVPQNIYSEYLANKDALRIIFEYPIPEREIKLFEKDNIIFHVGIASGKPMTIEIRKIKERKINKVKLSHTINDMIVKEIKETKNFRKQSNLKLASQILEESSEQLVPQ